MVDDKAKRFFKGLSKPTVAWVYLISAVTCVVLFVSKHIFNYTIYGHDAALLIITIFLAITECYVNFSENEEEKEKKEHFTTISVPSVVVVLIKAEWCSACKSYLNSNMWQKLMNSMYGSQDIQFMQLDIDNDRSKIYQTLNIQSSTISHVPVIYFASKKKGISQYNGDIYDNFSLQQTIRSLRN